MPTLALCETSAWQGNLPSPVLLQDQSSALLKLNEQGILTVRLRHCRPLCMIASFFMKLNRPEGPPCRCSDPQLICILLLRSSASEAGACDERADPEHV